MKNLNNFLLKNYLLNYKKILFFIYFWSSKFDFFYILKNNINKLKKIYKKKVFFLKIDINFNKFICEKFSIKKEFTILIILKKKVKKYIGIFNFNDLKILLIKNLKILK